MELVEKSVHGCGACASVGGGRACWLLLCSFGALPRLLGHEVVLLDGV